MALQVTIACRTVDTKIRRAYIDYMYSTRVETTKHRQTYTAMSSCQSIPTRQLHRRRRRSPWHRRHRRGHRDGPGRPPSHSWKEWRSPHAAAAAAPRTGEPENGVLYRLHSALQLGNAVGAGELGVTLLVTTGSRPLPQEGLLVASRRPPAWSMTRTTGDILGVPARHALVFGAD